MKNISIIIILMIFWQLAANASVWQAENYWDRDWEDAYSKWVENYFNEDIFIRGIYKGIPTDCADAVYAARIIFAFENKLVFSINDPTGGDLKITNEMSRFDDDEDPMIRLRKFIHYIGDMTNTKTLPQDTFPVVINREWVKAGGVVVRPRIQLSSFFGFGGGPQPGHAEVIKEVTDTGIIYLIGSTVPRAVRRLMTTSNLVFLPKNHNTGIRYWKTENLKMNKGIPGFSIEQFEMGKDKENNRRTLKSWKKEITKRLALKDETKYERKLRYGENLCAFINERIDVIQKSEAYRQKIGRCMNETEYDMYSTPSRDGKTEDSLLDLIVLNAYIPIGYITVRRIESIIPFLGSCREIEYAPGKVIPVGKFLYALKKTKYLTDPNQTLEARWGLEEPKKHGCKIYY